MNNNVIVNESHYSDITGDVTAPKPTHYRYIVYNYSLALG